jgi:predicted deacylase
MLISTLFPETYEESRARFRADLARVQTLWRDARLHAHCIDAAEDATIDWIAAHAERRERLVIFTTGEHGIEGYVGSAMLKIFVDEFLPRLDPTTTGILLVHTINPWGMKHKRRTNAHNVDLNRNFLWNSAPDKSFNPDYARLAAMLMPRGRVRNLAVSQLAFLARLLWRNARDGAGKIRATTLLGQYAHARGIFYGGDAIQEETRVLIGLLREWMREYAQIVHLDMHTGYGPRYQMQLVNSRFEQTDSREFEKRFNYPRVSKATSNEFYEIRGDLIDFVYALAQNEFPNQRVYSTTFEFGTLGDSTWNAVESLRIKVLENQMYWYGADDSARAKIAREFEELYAPRDEQWRAKAIADARQAFDGILRAEGFV